MSIEFLTVREVIEINKDQVERFGGEFVIEDPGNLETAIRDAHTTLDGDFVKEFPFEIAASYLISICKSRAFRNSNKRTAYTAALVFLDRHGWGINANDRAQEYLVLDVEEGKISRDEVADFFKSHAVQEENV